LLRGPSSGGITRLGSSCSRPPLGTPLDPPNFYRRVWQPALQLTGVADEGYRFHDLRHTCVSRLVAAGADVKLVQAVAGQANPLITLKRYSHLLDARITEAAERFDPAQAP
jgi:integrase